MPINIYILKCNDLYYLAQICSIFTYISAKNESSVYLFKFLDSKDILQILDLQANWMLCSELLLLSSAQYATSIFY